MTDAEWEQRDLTEHCSRERIRWGAYAGEMAWREDHRPKSNGVLYLMMTGAALAHPVSRQWKGYWQRRAL